LTAESLRSFQAAIGTILLIAAFAKSFGKTKGAEAFLKEIGLPQQRVHLAAVFAAGGEGVVGLGLIIGIAPTASSGAAAALFFVFLTAQVRHLRRGGQAGCRCFGALDEQMSSRLAGVRVLVLFTLAAAVTILSTARGDNARPPVDALPLIIGSLSGIAVVLIFAQAAALERFMRGIKLAKASLPESVS
jgi:uncharacterized membrane protein YphA (DoxX/SURF4 family)